MPKRLLRTSFFFLLMSKYSCPKDFCQCQIFDWYWKRKGVLCEGVRFVKTGRKFDISEVFGHEYFGSLPAIKILNTGGWA